MSSGHHVLASLQHHRKPVTDNNKTDHVIYYREMVTRVPCP